VIKAVLKSAQRHQAPVIFAVTLNQVDIDGGYTGYTHQSFVDKVYLEAKKIDFKQKLIFGIDHGGPWLKDLHREKKMSFLQSINKLKVSLASALDAGFNHFHIDAGIDFDSDFKQVSIEILVTRSLALIQYIEKIRIQKSYSAVSYEVGTEGKMSENQEVKEFKYFLKLLKTKLKENDLDYVFPEFVVANIATDLHTNQFDKELTTEYVAICKQFSCLLKAHYTDNIKNPEDFPKIGVGGANVGPEFTEIEYKTILSLEKKEKKLFSTGKIGQTSAIKQTLWDAVIKSQKWKKWLLLGEEKDFSKINLQRQEWLVKTGCRYIWKQPQVIKSRELLTNNLKIINIEVDEILLNTIEKAMDKYYRAFY